MTAYNINSLQTLLRNTAALVKRHHEVALARKENFNIFQVLRLEADEQRLHSRFIAHLLDPAGSHEMGSAFLEAFVKILEIPFAADRATVTTELHTGIVDQEKKVGGFIDIYLEDKNKQGISIENKIYAGDQENQLERYSNYRKGQNKVVYLTLHAIERPAVSDAVTFQDFIPISYSNEIMNWLKECHELSVDHPTLRETIKQYRQIVATITNAMSTKENDELARLMLADFESASFIAQNYESIRLEIAERLRDQVISNLRAKLDNSFAVEKGDKIGTKFAQIWVFFKKNDQKFDKVRFGIEPFNRGHSEPHLFYGVFDSHDLTENGFAARFNLTRFNAYWSNLNYFDPFEGEEISMSNPRLISIIGSDSTKLNTLADLISTKASAFIKDLAPALSDYIDELAQEQVLQNGGDSL
jgi:hypothetical protein